MDTKIEKTTHIRFTFHGEKCDTIDFKTIFERLGLEVSSGNVNTYYNEKKIDLTATKK